MACEKQGPYLAKYKIWTYKIILAPVIIKLPRITFYLINTCASELLHFVISTLLFCQSWSWGRECIKKSF